MSGLRINPLHHAPDRPAGAQAYNIFQLLGLYQVWSLPICVLAVWWAVTEQTVRFTAPLAVAAAVTRSGAWLMLPVTAQLVQLTASPRKRLGIPLRCFERATRLLGRGPEHVPLERSREAQAKAVTLPSGTFAAANANVPVLTTSGNRYSFFALRGPRSRRTSWICRCRTVSRRIS